MWDTEVESWSPSAPVSAALPPPSSTVDAGGEVLVVATPAQAPTTVEAAPVALRQRVGDPEAGTGCCPTRWTPRPTNTSPLWWRAFPSTTRWTRLVSTTQRAQHSSPARGRGADRRFVEPFIGSAAERVGREVHLLAVRTAVHEHAGLAHHHDAFGRRRVHRGHVHRHGGLGRGLRRERAEKGGRGSPSRRASATSTSDRQCPLQRIVFEEGVIVGVVFDRPEVRSPFGRVTASPCRSGTTSRPWWTD